MIVYRTNQDEDEMLRTFVLEHCANKSKLGKIDALFRSYRTAAKNFAAEQWLLFYANGMFDKNFDINIDSILSQRFLRCCLWQTVGVLKGFIEKVKEAFVKLVTKRKAFLLQEKMYLCYINKYNKWFAESVSMKKNPIPQKYLQLAKQIFKHFLKKFKKPNFDNMPLMLNHNVAQISQEILDNDKHDATYADFWINVSTLEKGKPVLVPLFCNEYFLQQDGDIKKFVRISREQNDLNFALVMDIEKKEYTPLTDKIGVDIGLINLFATDQGHLFGHSLYPYLKDLDAQIQKLEKERRRRGLSVKSKRYDKLICKLRNFLKNEMFRCLNRLVELYRPARIVLENLDFLQPNMSKTMNRLIRRFGLRFIKEKLELLKENYGIEIEYVHAAYTSKCCSECGYISPTNRKDRDTFICDFCHTNLYSDVVGARNVLVRSSRAAFDIYKGKQDILRELTSSFLKKHDASSKRPHSWTRTLVANNSYFAPQLQVIQGFS